MIWAVVPLKSPERAKLRLAPVLTPEARRELFFTLARRMLESLRAAQGIERVVVVTSTDEVAAFAREFGAHVVLAPDDRGTAEAFAFGLAALRPQLATGVLMIAGDLPLVTASALSRLVQAAPPHGVTIVPDRRREGTNALICTPADALAPCFGEDSFARHLDAAHRQGLAVHVCDDDALTLDLDLPDDLAFLAARDVQTAKDRDERAIAESVAP